VSAEVAAGAALDAADAAEALSFWRAACSS
jgi:hypothetical protein